MSEHIRPAHPGCRQCANCHFMFTNNSGDLGAVKKNLIRAQTHYPEMVARYVDEIAALKAKRAQDIEVYHLHYADAHPVFADSAHPFERAPSHRLTADDVAEIKQLLREGVPYGEIAEAFDVSKSTITYHAIRAGLGARLDKPAPAPETPSEQPNLMLDDQPWADQALCAQTDPEAFYPEKGGSTREAKAVCARCAVAAECLDYALENQERFGIWGGLSERERRKLLKATTAEEEPTTTPPTEGTAA